MHHADRKELFKKKKNGSRQFQKSLEFAIGRIPSRPPHPSFSPYFWLLPSFYLSLPLFLPSSPFSSPSLLSFRFCKIPAIKATHCVTHKIGQKIASPCRAWWERMKTMPMDAGSDCCKHATSVPPFNFLSHTRKGFLKDERTKHRTKVYAQGFG